MLVSASRNGVEPSRKVVQRLEEKFEVILKGTKTINGSLEEILRSHAEEIEALKAMRPGSHRGDCGTKGCAGCPWSGRSDNQERAKQSCIASTRIVKETRIPVPVLILALFFFCMWNDFSGQVLLRRVLKN